MNVDLSVFLKQKAMNDRQSAGDSRLSGGNFTDFFEKAEYKMQSEKAGDRNEGSGSKSETSEKYGKRQTEKSSNKAENYKPGKAKDRAKPVNKSNSMQRQVNDTHEEATESADNWGADVADKERVVNQPEENISEDSAADTPEEELLNKLADILQTPVEELKQILAALNLTPADLADKANLNTFMQKVFDVTEVTQLLSIENIGQIYRETDEALEQFAEAALQNLTEALQAQESAENTEHTVQTQEMPVKTEVMVKQAVIVEDKVQNTEITDSKTAASQQEPATVTQNPAPSAGQTGQGQTGNHTGNENSGGIPVTENQNTTGAPLNLNQTVEKVFAESLEKAKLPYDVEPKEILNQIHDKIKVEVRGSLSEIRVNLKPEQLGDVTLKIATQNGIITAQFVAENQRVKEIIESNFNQLKDVLKEQGIEINNLSVSVGQDKANQQGNEFKRNAQVFDRRNSLKSAQAVDIPEEAVAEITQDSNVNYLA